MIRLLDRNCDEQITFEEFCRFACMLPRNQIENNNVAFCWVDSADFMDGLAFRLNMVHCAHILAFYICQSCFAAGSERNASL